MMTPIGTGEKGQKSNSRSFKLLLSWQRALLGFYVALFALVLPLICWGALAEPGHPHRYPHFVFADPLLVATPDAEAMANWQAHSVTLQLALVRHGQHRGQPRVAVKQASASLVCSMLADDVIPGRATSTLMIFSILLLVFFTAWAMRPLDLPHFAIWQRLQLPQSILLPVPLPPPRLLLPPVLLQA